MIILLDVLLIICVALLFYSNHSWSKFCKEQNESWYQHCKNLNEKWHKDSINAIDNMTEIFKQYDELVQKLIKSIKLSNNHPKN